MVVDCSLRDAAVCGDEKTFRRLVQDGQEANSVLGALILGASSFDELDVSRTKASAPGRLSILSYLLENRCLSLYTLNASHASLKGLTPLGMATYLDHLDFVTALLERGDGLVLVDGTDSQKATPIMYAARDGHTEVLKYLINKGARVTSVDWQHRSVLFYSTASPQCLWECELNLRLQRAESLLEHGKKRQLKLTLQQDVSEYDSLACLYQQHTAYPLSPSALQSSVRRLVNSITSSDLSAVHSLLFPTQNSSQSSSVPVPVLVNLRDENGWSPIHYCVTSPRPSSAILDALFLAGADLALYTADNSMTPLHALARFGGSGATTSFRLYAFIVHLVRDLGAPLDAVDLQGETCIHVAARHGRCADILMALLECDEGGKVAQLRNNNGQTAYDVAKADFCSIFEQDDGNSIRSGSSVASLLRTIKPSISSASLGTSYSYSSRSSSSDDDDNLIQGEEQFPRPISREKESLRVTLTNPSEAQQFIDRLGYLLEKVQRSETRRDGNNALGLLMETSKQSVNDDMDHIDGLLKQAQRSGRSLLELNRQLIDAELDDLHAAQEVHAGLEQLIVRLEERALTIEEEEGSQTPSLSSYRRLSEAPSLVASGSSASLTSLTDLAALVTPTCSPRTSLQEYNVSKEQRQKQAENTHSTVELPEEAEVDFACALAAGSVTRRRRTSALNGIFALGNTDIDTHCPLEEGVNLVSIPPTRAPEVQDVIIHVPSESRGPSPDGLNTNPASPPHQVQKKESWLDPYVRRANSDILKAHLANLLEIEQMLFGAEDQEMEEAPSPGSVSDEASEDGWSWREGVESLQEDVAEAHIQAKDEGNFLDMFGAEEVGNGEDAYAPFLDLLVQSEWDEEDDGDCDSRRASTVKPSTVHKRYSRFESLTAFDILGIAKQELYAVEESMLTACRSIETAQRYVHQAEHLMNDICQKMEGLVQPAVLPSFASYDESCMSMRSRSRSSSVSTVVLSPAPGTHGSAYAADLHPFALPPSSTSSRYSKTDHRPSKQSLRPAPSMPSLSSRFCASPSPSASPLPPVGAAALTDDIQYLRHMLVRKIPIWLDATAYDVDKAATWVGIVQTVVRNVVRTRLRL